MEKYRRVAEAAQGKLFSAKIKKQYRVNFGSGMILFISVATKKIQKIGA